MARKVISITEDSSGSWKVGSAKSQPWSVCKRVPRRYRLQRLFLWGCAGQPRGCVFIRGSCQHSGLGSLGLALKDSHQNRKPATTSLGNFEELFTAF